MTVDRDARTRLRALCDKAAEGPWFVEHGARADGLSRVDDGRQHGLYSFYCEAHEAAFIAASREAVPELLDMVDAQAKDVDIWKDKAKFRLARAEKAEAALRPFAEAANDWDDAEDSDGVLTPSIDVSVLRRARAVLAEVTSMPQGEVKP